GKFTSAQLIRYTDMTLFAFHMSNHLRLQGSHARYVFISQNSLSFWVFLTDHNIWLAVNKITSGFKYALVQLLIQC
ncbi:hypothetical protein D041_0429B, partial [Vibrio parahaemolyticus EKP-008]